MLDRFYVFNNKTRQVTAVGPDVMTTNGDNPCLPDRGAWCCDTHPRSSRDGRLVCIDTLHGGNGRQMYVIDVRKLLG